MSMRRMTKLRLYQITVIFSVLFALLGFSYNVWRMEVTEHNNNIRTACFEMLLELSELEQVVYAGFYDNDPIEGSPRKGWVKVGLISDLSALGTDEIRKSAYHLKQVWTDNWENTLESRESVDAVVAAIDAVRSEIKTTLSSLE